MVKSRSDEARHVAAAEGVRGGRGNYFRFSRAAEELHLTQPAVSTQVPQAGRARGQRSSSNSSARRSTSPRRARSCFKIGRAIIQQFEAAESAMTQFKGVSGGRLNVGFHQRR